MAIKTSKIETTHGTISVQETDGAGPTILMIHGNSASGAVFHNQFDGRIGRDYHLVAIDLPGHGASSDAIDPDRTYNFAGYADAATEIMEKLDYKDAVVFGWSLGGHIGLEMIDRYKGMRGLMITGTPPVGAADMMSAFKMTPLMALTGKETFTEEDAQTYAKATIGDPYNKTLYDFVRRADGRARSLMLGKIMQGIGRDQGEIVRGLTPPIAVVNGADEPFINVDFIDKIPFSNLWEGKQHLIAGSGHAPFRDAPAQFDARLDRFVKSLG